METSPSSVSAGRVAIWTVTVVIVAGIMLALYSLRDLLLMFFVAIVVAAALRPLVLGLQRYRLPRAAAAIIVYLTVLGVIIAALAFIIPLLAEQIVGLIDQAPALYNSLLATLRESSSRVLRTVGSNLPNLRDLSELRGLFASMMTEDSLMATINSAIALVSAFVTVFTVAFYWTLDQTRMERLWLSIAPPTERPRILLVWREMENKMGSYLRGTGILAIIITVLTSIGYVAIGLPYALVLALLAGMGEFIPVIGFIIGSLPAAIIGLTVSPQTALLVMGINIVIQQLENYVLAPRVMSDSVGVSPVVIIVALLAFGSLFGLVGAFLAIPMAAIIQVLLDRFILKTDMVTEDIPEARPLVAARSRLRTLRARVRERIRSREEDIDVNAGLDALDQRIEDVVLTVDRAISEASQDPDAVEPEVIETIEKAIAQVAQLAADSRDTNSPVGLNPEDSDDQEAVDEVDTVLQEAHQTLKTAADEVRGMAAAEEELDAAPGKDDRGNEKNPATLSA